MKWVRVVNRPGMWVAYVEGRNARAAAQRIVELPDSADRGSLRSLRRLIRALAVALAGSTGALLAPE